MLLYNILQNADKIFGKFPNRKPVNKRPGFLKMASKRRILV